jgi:hypothetical protein
MGRPRPFLETQRRGALLYLLTTRSFIIARASENYVVVVFFCFSTWLGPFINAVICLQTFLLYDIIFDTTRRTASGYCTGTIQKELYSVHVWFLRTHPDKLLFVDT